MKSIVLAVMTSLALAGPVWAQGSAGAAVVPVVPTPGAVATVTVPKPQGTHFLSMRLRMRMNLIDNGFLSMTRKQFNEHYWAAHEILEKLKAQRMTPQQQQYALMTELRLRELDSQFENLQR